MQPQPHASSQGPRNVLPPLHSGEGQSHESSHRLGSGMSISAMLGADASSPRDTRLEANGAQQRPFPTSTLPPSQSSPGPMNSAHTSGGSTLDRYKSWYPDNSRPPHNYSSTLPPRPFSDSHDSEPPRFALPLKGASSQSPSRPERFSEASSPHDTSNYGPRKYSLSDPKPLSSGRSYDPHLGGLERRPMEDSRKAPTKPALNDNFRFTFPPHSPTSYDKGSKAYLAPKATGSQSFLNSTSTTEYPFLSRPAQPSSQKRPAPAQIDKLDSSQLPNTSQPRHSNLPTVPGAHSQHISTDSPVAAFRSLQEPRTSSIPLSESPEQRRDSPLSHLQRQLAASAAGADDSGSSPELSRKSLSLLNDNKRGRVSPLPQAVQGAQPQLRGPASEPGIKNEFARMFSGIGSGVGSAVSTPVPPDNQPLGLPSSPLGPEEGDRRTPLSRRKELMNEAKPRNTSRTGRRSRKLKDGEVKKEAEDSNGAGLGKTLNGRGQKKTRNNYQNVSSNLSQG